MQAKFSALAIDYEQTKDTAAHIHLTILGGLDIDWTKFLSSNSCLICLRRPPEHPLNCGHSMCDTCVRIFGKPSLSMEHCYTVETCQLCNLKRHLTIRLKPPTAGSRLLALDGGGIRGAITLQILMALEKQLRLPYPIYDTFDMALGASTGKGSSNIGNSFTHDTQGDSLL